MNPLATFDWRLAQTKPIFDKFIKVYCYEHGAHNNATNLTENQSIGFGHQSAVEICQISSDGLFALTASNVDHTRKLWDLTSLKVCFLKKIESLFLVRFANLSISL
jgi:WD40 repeat protein